MKSKNKMINEIQKEQAFYNILSSKLDQLKLKVLKDELPGSLSQRGKEQIEFHIIELRELLQNCDRELQSTLDDLINE